MRTKLLATVAMTALIGCTSLAVAQNAGREGGAMQSQGAQQHQMGGSNAASPPSGGAMSGQGNAQNEATPSTSGPQGSGEQGKGFSQQERTKAQRGAQEQRSPQNQRGAQNNESGRTGANGTQERMGEDQEHGKAIQGQAQQNGTAGRSGAAAVQLSQDQRTKIKDIVVRDRNVARVDKPDFNIGVGVTVPRTVHVAVLPPEVVTIVPEYRGFDYVVVGDQLLIIDPHTLEIVAILPA
jgi:Protein of unknown function (DUF1236)